MPSIHPSLHSLMWKQVFTEVSELRTEGRTGPFSDALLVFCLLFLLEKTPSKSYAVAFQKLHKLPQTGCSTLTYLIAPIKELVPKTVVDNSTACIPK